MTACRTHPALLRSTSPGAVALAYVEVHTSNSTTSSRDWKLNRADCVRGNRDTIKWVRSVTCLCGCHQLLTMTQLYPLVANTLVIWKKRPSICVRSKTSRSGAPLSVVRVPLEMLSWLCACIRGPVPASSPLGVGRRTWSQAAASCPLTGPGTELEGGRKRCQVILRSASLRPNFRIQFTPREAFRSSRLLLRPSPNKLTAVLSKQLNLRDRALSAGSKLSP